MPKMMIKKLAGWTRTFRAGYVAGKADARFEAMFRRLIKGREAAPVVQCPLAAELVSNTR